MAKKKKDSIEVEAEPISDEEALLFDLPEVGIQTFKDPMKLKLDELEQTMADLIQGRDQNEAHLAACLFAAEERKVWIDRGFERKDYYEQRMKFSPSKATAMEQTWRALAKLGIADLKVLKGLAWTKVKALKSGIDAKVIDGRNIQKWLRACAIVGEDSKLLTEIEKEVKELVGKKAKETGDQTLKNVSFKIEAFELPLVTQFEQIAEAVLGDNRGRNYLQALIEFSTAHADAVDAKLWQVRGLLALRELAERIAPVVSIFIPLNKEMSKKNLGVEPVFSIYQGYSETPEGPRELRYCIAQSEKEAKNFMGTKNVKEFPLEIAPSFMPAKPFELPKPEEEEPAEPTPETPEGKPKKRRKKAEEKPATEKAPWELPKDELPAAIRALVKKLKVPQDTYKAKKAELAKKRDEGLSHNQAILKWLMEEDQKRPS